MAEAGEVAGGWAEAEAELVSDVLSCLRGGSRPLWLLLVSRCRAAVAVVVVVGADGTAEGKVDGDVDVDVDSQSDFVASHRISIPFCSVILGCSNSWPGAVQFYAVGW